MYANNDSVLTALFIIPFILRSCRQDTAPPKQESHLLDLLDINLGATSISSPADAWGMSKQPTAADPWSTTAGGAAGGSLDPWHSGGAPVAARNAAVAAGGGAAAIGGGAGAANVESWLSRTQSPSSGSSGDSAWLQNNGAGASGASHANGSNHSNGYAQAAGASGGVSDPWLGGGAGRHGAAGAVVDPWLNKAAHPTPQDPWQSPNLNSSNGHGMAGAGGAAAAGAAGQVIDPWTGPSPTIGARPSPIGAQMSPNSDLDDFDVITNRSKSTVANNNNCKLKHNCRSYYNRSELLI